MIILSFERFAAIQFQHSINHTKIRFWEFPHLRKFENKLCTNIPIPLFKYAERFLSKSGFYKQIFSSAHDKRGWNKHSGVPLVEKTIKLLFGGTSEANGVFHRFPHGVREHTRLLRLLEPISLERPSEHRVCTLFSWWFYKRSNQNRWTRKKREKNCKRTDTDQFSFRLNIEHRSPPQTRTMYSFIFFKYFFPGGQLWMGLHLEWNTLLDTVVFIPGTSVMFPIFSAKFDAFRNVA